MHDLTLGAFVIQMNRTRFETNKRLWLFISVGLFLVPWFALRMGKGDGMCPAGLWLVLFEYPDHGLETLGVLLILSLSFGTVAVVIGWVLQCLVVVIQSKFRR